MKPITAIVVLLLVVASFSVAGCSVTNTGDNSSQNQIQFPTIETSDLSKEITANYASNGYEIVKAFTKATNQYGNVVYTGVVKEGNETHLNPYQHNVTVELMKNKTETQQRVSQLAAIYKSWGFPANMTGTYQQTDSKGNQMLMGGCNPNTNCLSGMYKTFGNFTVVLDFMTR